MKITGGCLCGQVRYSADTEPAFVGVCHCKNCQKGNGSAFSVEYVGSGDSGNSTSKKFCPECGSPITVEAGMMPGVTMVEVGTLDDPAVAQPSMHIYCRSKMEWVPIPEGVGAFPEMPSRG